MRFRQAVISEIDTSFENMLIEADRASECLLYKKNEVCRNTKEMVVHSLSIALFIEASVREEIFFWDSTLASWNLNSSSLAQLKSIWKKERLNLYAAIYSMPSEEFSSEIKTPWGIYAWQDLLIYCYMAAEVHAKLISYILSDIPDQN